LDWIQGKNLNTLDFLPKSSLFPVNLRPHPPEGGVQVFPGFKAFGRGEKNPGIPSPPQAKKLVFSPPQAEIFGILSQPCAHFDFD